MMTQTGGEQHENKAEDKKRKEQKGIKKKRGCDETGRYAGSPTAATATAVTNTQTIHST